MDTVKGIVMSRRTAIGTLVVLALAGVTLGVMSYGPSEAERAYALACEAILEQLPEDQRASAVFPRFTSGQVRHWPPSNTADDCHWLISSYETSDTYMPWRVRIARGGDEVVEVILTHNMIDIRHP